MKVVGLTGGIGSGKTTVAKLFAKLEIPVYDSDSRAKALYTESSALRTLMINHFGPEIYQGKSINRIKLAQIVFSDKSELANLNAFVHPLLQADFDQWKDKQKASYVIREAAILIESGAFKGCDKVVVVSALEDIRIKRVMARDGVSFEQVKSRISNQLSDQERLAFSDFEINNSGSVSLIEQVVLIHDLLKD
jgi:dephospho-CoA kinase